MNPGFTAKETFTTVAKVRDFVSKFNKYCPSTYNLFTL